MSDKIATCGAPKVADGEPCPNSMGLCPDCGHCFVHCEHRADKLARAQSRGGHSTARKRGDAERVARDEEAPDPPKTLADALTWSAWAAHAVATGRLDTSRGNAVAKLLTEFRRTLEKSESREKLEEIRAKVAELTGDPPDLEAL